MIRLILWKILCQICTLISLAMSFTFYSMAITMDYQGKYRVWLKFSFAVTAIIEFLIFIVGQVYTLGGHF